MDELLFVKEKPKVALKLNPRDALDDLYRSGHATDDDYRKLNIYPLKVRAAAR